MRGREKRSSRRKAGIGARDRRSTSARAIERCRSALRQPGRGPAEDDLDRDQGQEQTADQRDRRRHRQAVRQPEQHDEEREGPVLEHCHDFAHGQALARLRGKGEQDLRSARVGKQGALDGFEDAQGALSTRVRRAEAKARRRRDARCSMKRDLTLDGSEFRGLDQLRMRHRDRMQRPGELALPELEKIDQHGESRGEIVFLPDIGLDRFG